MPTWCRRHQGGPPNGDDTRYISVARPANERCIRKRQPGQARHHRGPALRVRKSALRALVEQADVFIHSMRSKAINRLASAIPR
ncbi:hypothetical protein BZL30_9489 [Mycobacterium kansasii]|uniref:Uncharacterized protein n=1 Tax=Mycobacterium kansasii TaxID=1768 RepID=A0A1V3WAG8_MYCKA|nr:hypothetical protein BZL30_9489 [Mycobacterium kansasii]